MTSRRHCQGAIDLVSVTDAGWVAAAGSFET